jgi:glycosyltransferase involved in cell wall biosynthesis
MLIKTKKKYLKISIVTVCLNSEKTIKRCLESVISQNYPNNKIEHIVIDGASTDSTVSIIKKKIKHIKFFQSRKDHGIYDAMNIGIKKCTGDVIGILNSDDFFYKNTFKTVAKYFNQSKIDYLFGSVLKGRVYHNFLPHKLWYTFNIYPSHSVSFFIKKKTQNEVGKYNIKFNYSADRDLFYRLIRNKKFVGTSTNKNEIFGKFDLYGISSKVSFFQKNLEEIRIRLSNKENFLKVFLLFFVYFFYFSLKKIISFFK